MDTVHKKIHQFSLGKKINSIAMKLRDMFYFIAFFLSFFFFFFASEIAVTKWVQWYRAAVHPSKANLTFIWMHLASHSYSVGGWYPGRVWLRLKQRIKDAERCLHTLVPAAAWSNLLWVSVGSCLKNWVLMYFSFYFPSHLQLKHLKKKKKFPC